MSETFHSRVYTDRPPSLMTQMYGEEVNMDCTKCPYALLDYDDAYGATIWWVEGCKREEGCIREENDD